MTIEAMTPGKKVSMWTAAGEITGKVIRSTLRMGTPPAGYVPVHFPNATLCVHVSGLKIV